MFSALCLRSLRANRIGSRLLRMTSNSVTRSPYLPPEAVAHMKQFDLSAFNKDVRVPYVEVDVQHFKKASIVLKQYPILFRVSHIEEIDEHHRRVLLDPEKIESFEDFTPQQQVFLRDVCKVDKVKHKGIKVTFNNYSYTDIMKAVFPDENMRVTGFSMIGHIIHLNLKPRHEKSKHIIGEILLQLYQPKIKIVLSKLQKIDSVFRNFDYEILAQTPDAGEFGTIVRVSSLRCRFEFDFAKVYWNPRLNTEHERIRSFFTKGRDVVYDVFAGVGPFAIPAAAAKCKVYANDLNPEAYKWLEVNRKLNKVDKFLEISNLDGREFIQKVAKNSLIEEWSREDLQELVVKPNYNFIMNLPKLAIEFLDVFAGLMGDHKVPDGAVMPTMYVYCFETNSGGPEVRRNISERIGKALNHKLDDLSIFKVRTTSPGISMYRVKFKMPLEVLRKIERPRKRLKIPDGHGEDCGVAHDLLHNKM